MLELNEAKVVLSDLVQKEKLILFAGSGVSVGSGLPTWDGFLVEFIEFCRQIRTDYKRYPEVQEAFTDELLSDAASVTSSYPIHVATVLKEKMETLPSRIATNIESDFRKWFVRLFTGKTPNNVHNLIARTKYPYILTSNYDDLLELAAKDAGAPHATVSFHQKSLVAEFMYNEQPAIIHVHGTALDAMLNRVVLTSEDYIRIIKKGVPGFSFALQSLFLRYSTLFVGYGASDPHLEDLIEEFAYFFDFEESHTMSKNYLVIRRDKAQSIMDAYKKRMRTEIIVIDDFDQYEDLLEELRSSAPL